MGYKQILHKLKNILIYKILILISKKRFNIIICKLK